MRYRIIKCLYYHLHFINRCKLKTLKWQTAAVDEIDEDGEKLMSTDTEEDSIHITENEEDRLFRQRNVVTPVKTTTGVVQPSVADIVNRKY